MSRRLDILYLVHRVPYPPNRGDRIRSFHVLEFLAQRANVHLATLADEPVAAETGRALAERCERVAIEGVGRERWVRGAASLAAGRSATEGLFSSPPLRRVLRAWARQTRFDAIVAFCSSMTPYLFLPELRHTPAVMDLVDVDSQKWLDYAAAARGAKRRLYGLEATLLAQLEARAAQRAAAVLLVSEAEAALFRRVCPNDRTYAIQNGVDLDYFQPTAGDGRANRCVFVGALDYRPNIDGVRWFVEHVWPRVRAQTPGATFAVVGRQPDKRVQKLAAVEGVEVIGAVPDVRPHLAEASLVVAPLRIARGVQNKVLEAMAAARPVIASPGALEGLGARPGIELEVADDPAEWVEAVARLFRDEAARRRLAAAGRAYVEAHHSWSQCLAPLDDLLGAIAKPAARTAAATR